MNIEEGNPVKLYRPAVAGLIQRGDGRILIGERLDVENAWQFPQGGVDAGESHVQALYRELLEEIALKPNQYRVVLERGPYRYDFATPKIRRGWHGQEQRYFLCEIDPAAVDRVSVRTKKPEFRSLRWVYPSEFQAAWLPPMKISVYEQVLRDFFSVEMQVVTGMSLTSPPS